MDKNNPGESDANADPEQPNGIPNPGNTEVHPADRKPTRRILPREHAKEITAEELHAAVGSLDEKEKGWSHTLLVLGLSLFAFLSAGLLKEPLADLVLLVVVLFIHEAGHFAGMRFFNYRNVKMLFIPFFGAAVSGQRTHVEEWKNAVVCLLGPLPGIGIGLGLGAWNLWFPDPLLGRIAAVFLLVNAANLLPIFPLDGGRFLNDVLFVRSPALETLFRALAGVAGLYFAYAWGAWILGVIGFFVLLSSSDAWRVGILAKSIRAREMDRGGIPPERVTPEFAQAILPELRRAFPNTVEAKSLALHAKSVWEKAVARPPGLAATILLLGTYFGTIALLFVALLAFVVAGNIGLERRFNAAAEAAERQDWAKAEAHYQEALVLARGMAAGDLRQSYALHGLGSACAELGRDSEAETHYREALALREQALGPDDLAVEETLMALAALLSKEKERRAPEVHALVERVNTIRAKHGLEPIGSKQEPHERR